MRGEVADGRGENRLSSAIREVKNAAADRGDVVVELREATRMRLELLATELEPVFAEVPADVDIFDFAVSSGLQPRLWIDAIAHVSMARDRRTYRFLKDTRIGRVVLAESADMKPVAEQVTRYVAERMVERQRMLDGGVEPGTAGLLQRGVGEAVAPLRVSTLSRGTAAIAALALVVAGALFGLGASLALLWQRMLSGS
jgi:hypothetical protein